MTKGYQIHAPLPLSFPPPLLLFFDLCEMCLDPFVGQPGRNTHPFFTLPAIFHKCQSSLRSVVLRTRLERCKRPHGVLSSTRTQLHLVSYRRLRGSAVLFPTGPRSCLLTLTKRNSCQTRRVIGAFFFRRNLRPVKPLGVSSSPPQSTFSFLVLFLGFPGASP